MANQRLTDKELLSTQIYSDDLFHVVDVSDTTGSSAGTSKKVEARRLIVTTRASFSNAEIQALNSTPQEMFSPPSGYYVIPIGLTLFCEYAAGIESSSYNLYMGHKGSGTVYYWDYGRDLMNGVTADRTYIFSSGAPGSVGVYDGDLSGVAFSIWSNGAFNGGWTAKAYFTCTMIEKL
tara:strand:+ start:699 stop:1232 length:534 start_codon:yes stop_codon:yes gene_type:complete